MAPEPAHSLPGTCPNCGSAREQSFCSACGQSARDPRRDVRSLIAELVGGLFWVDGRLWRTLGPLFLRPGALTRAWTEGRRVSYMAPLRVFLVFSILLFLLLQTRANVTGILTRESDGDDVVRIESDGDEVQGNFDLPLPDFWPFDALQRRLDEREVEFNRLTEKEQLFLLASRGLDLAPVGLLLLLPLMAAFLKLWWLGTGAYYVDHLVFLMHAYAFSCGLIAALMLLALPTWANFAALALLAAYFHRGMRVAYARGFWRTAGATLLGSLLTLFAAMLVAVVMLPWALLTW